MDSKTKKQTFDVKLDEGDQYRNEVTHIFSSNFESFDSNSFKQRYEWLNELNPPGKSLTYVLFDNEADKIVGVQSVCLRRFEAGGNQLLAGTMIDLVVDKSYRSLGPAMQLLKRSTKSAREKLAFLYGFPNRKAAPVFKRAGAKTLGCMQRMARVLHTHEYLRGRMPRVFSRPISLLADFVLVVVDGIYNVMALRSLELCSDNITDEQINSLWKESNYEDTLVSRRDADTLSWRYKNGRSYPNLQKVYIFAKDKDKTPIAYILFTVDHEIIKIQDFFVVELKRNLIVKVWRLFIWYSRKFNVSSLSVEFFGVHEVNKALHKVGFVQRETANIVILQGCKEVSEDENMWYITSFDRDT